MKIICFELFKHWNCEFKSAWGIDAYLHFSVLQTLQLSDPPLKNS